MDYKGWVIVTRPGPVFPVGIYKDNDAWRADDHSQLCNTEEEAKQWIDEHSIQMSDEMKEMKVNLHYQESMRPGYKSTPIEEKEFHDKLEPLRLEEREAYGTYNVLSDEAYQMGRPDIAEKLKQIAEDEWKHHTVISEVVRELK